MRIRSFLPSALRPLLAAMVLSSAMAGPACAVPAPGDPILEARDALRKRDAKRLVTLRNAVRAEQHGLAMWVDYWELGNRISEVRADEVEAFYTRWSGTYVEDRLRNDWLLELGNRRDWARFARDYPRFRMNDDREVSCYWHADRAPGGAVGARRGARAVVRPARQRRRLLADGQHAGRGQGAGQRRRVDEAAPERREGRARLARQVATLIDKHAAADTSELLDNPARYLRRQSGTPTRNHLELVAAGCRARWPATMPMPPPV